MCTYLYRGCSNIDIYQALQPYNYEVKDISSLSSYYFGPWNYAMRDIQCCHESDLILISLIRRTCT